MQYAPIVIFAFNRLEPLKACVAALQTNTEALDSDLIVFVDGPRSYIDGESEKVEHVCDFVKTISGFKSITYRFSDINKKLGPSIIAGVTEVVNQYGKVIVMEDDLVVSKNFLSFMNQGLDLYEHQNEVWSICGFSCKLKVPRGYESDAYFCPRSSSWGWATWVDRWMSCDWELRDWDTVEKNRHIFNTWGGSDCFGMLKGWHEGRNHSWAIRFCYNQFVNNALSLFPIVSKVDNEGFDGSGTNCKQYSRYKFDFDTSEKNKFLMPENICVNKKILRQFLWYYSIPIRAYSKLRYIIDDLKKYY